MEPLFEILLETALQVVVEALCASGVRMAEKEGRSPARPWLSAFGHAVLGFVAGALSVLVFPSLFLTSAAARYANVALGPIAAGGCMAAVGAWRARREQRITGLERFAFAYLFALSMLVARLMFCD